MRKFILCLGLVLSAGTLLHAELIIVLTSGNRLLFVESETPGTVSKTITITGLSSGEMLHGIDFRPWTGSLYALGETSIYTINTDTGAARAEHPRGFYALPSGTHFGMDFNPTVPTGDALLDGDRIRVTTEEDKNWRYHPQTAAFLFVDPDLHYAATDTHAGVNPHVVGNAHNNNFSGSRATILYNIDSNLDILTIQDPPNAGVLHTVGPLGVDTTEDVGFDISGSTGVAYASLRVGMQTQLYSINLLSGAATALGPIGDASILGGETIVGMAATVPPASKLSNIATRGRVGQGDDVLIGGFITRDGSDSKYLLRAIGPSLSGTGIVGPLADTIITLYDQHGLVRASNDDWRDSQEADIAASGLAPSNNAESALISTLLPASYTAVVSGKNGGTGVAVLEIYQLQ